MECVLRPCKNKGGSTVKVGSKGLHKILECSSVKNDGLYEELQGKDSVTVHVECRKNYTRCPVPLAECRPTTSQHVPRSVFDFNTQCFLCERRCSDSNKLRNPSREVWSEVSTIELVGSLRNFTAQRGSCVWAQEVERRLAGVIDLVAANGRYHRYCYSRYQVPGSSKPGEETKWGGARVPEGRETAFEELCKFIEENDECQYTLTELITKLSSIDPLAGPKSEQGLKAKLEKHYGDSIKITAIPGKPSVMCFAGLAGRILSNKWYEDRKHNYEEEKKRVVEAAANIILQDIRSQVYDCSVYPSVDELISGTDVIPESLSLLINSIIMPKPQQKNCKSLKRKSIAIQHSLMSAVRPRSFLSPLGIGLSVHLHRRYGSKMLVDLLSNLGVCASYKEALKYEASVTVNRQTTIDPEAYVQFVFDNADHNVNTLDGHSTFHAMGGIQCITPATAIKVSDNVQRPANTPSSALIGSFGLRTVSFYTRTEKSGYSNITVEDITQQDLEPESAVVSRYLDTLWAAGTLLDVNRTGWNGFMERAYGNTPSYEVSSVIPLPFVNLSPNNFSTIYTCLLFAAEECQSRGQSHVLVTFDQPLFAKATEIVLAAAPGSPLSRVVVRLGGFHLLLSFLGSVGHIMAGSGLEEMWANIYAKNSVVHMLSGRAYSRALRAHLLSYQALTTLLFDSFPLDENMIEECKLCYQALFESTRSVDDMQDSEVLKKLFDAVTGRLNQYMSSGRTQKLWVQYLKMIAVITLFVRAERSGDWNLHIYSVQLMLPYLHASCHLNYARSAHVYLQVMLKLEETLTADELRKIVHNGYFTIRRSNKFWSGIWSDMTIEQVLMRSMKTSGGLTTGRGMSPATISRWVNTMPSTSKVTEAIEEFSGVSGATSEQHIDLRESRQSRDQRDIQILVEWLRVHNPFERPTTLLTSISTGVVANEYVNCDDAEKVGTLSLKKTTGKEFSSVTLHRKDAVKSLANVSKAIKVRGNEIVVNPNQLFHRIVCIVRSDEELASYLQYELAARPPALFDDVSIRKGNKSSLIPILEMFASPDGKVPDGATFIVDGGYLLYQVVWHRQGTYKQICEQYISFLEQRYGQCYVVFDGYGISCTKDSERKRRSRSSASVDIIVEDSVFVTTTQQDFLANSVNKARLISLLKVHLESSGFHVIQATSDADTLLVATAMHIAISGISVLVGQDTDLLVLLVALVTNNVFMLIPGTSKRADRVFNVRKLQEGLGDMAQHLLFLHAFTGCDTTSAIFNKGKKAAFKTLKNDEAIRNHVDIFNFPDASAERIAAAGENFFLALYGMPGVKDINIARHRFYLRTITKQKLGANFNLASLPPTKAAAQQHSYRVYHQVQQWRGMHLPPISWGWKLVENEGFVPITTLLEPAPENLLRLTCCNCKNFCEKNCECRRSSLTCTSMCGQCAGIGCSNASSACDEDDVENLQESTWSSCAELDNSDIIDHTLPPPAQRQRRD